MRSLGPLGRKRYTMPSTATAPTITIPVIFSILNIRCMETPPFVEFVSDLSLKFKCPVSGTKGDRYWHLTKLPEIVF
jgi:hypothetical protein